MLGTVRLSAKVLLDVARGIIRRRGLIGFLRKLPPLPVVLALMFPRNVAFAPGEEVAGSLDKSGSSLLDRETGLVEGWALAKHEPIDRIEILVDERPVGDASIALPHPTICAGLPDAAVCGFRIYLPESVLAEERDSIRVGFVAHGLSGRVYPFAAREMRLTPRTADQGPGVELPGVERPGVERPGVERPGVERPGVERIESLAGKRTPPRSHGKIRIACFTHDLDFGGAQLFLAEFLRQSAGNEGLAFEVFSPSDGPLRRDLEALGLKVELFRRPSRTQRGHHDLETAALGRRLSDGGYDCVLANTLAVFFAVNAAAAAKIPSIWAVHESFSLPVWSAIYAGWQPGRGFIRHRLDSALAQASTVTFVAEATRRPYLGLPRAERFIRIPYGIDVAAIERYLATFDRAAWRSRLSIEPGSFVLLFVGNFEGRKQQILLAQAFAEISRRHPRAVLVLVGELPSLYSAILRNYIQERGIGSAIRLIPATPETFPWYGIADAFVLLSDIESMPRALMEAMAFGLPALATNVYGIPELIEDVRTGFLIPPNSLGAAVGGLERLIGMSQEERRTIGLAAKETIARDHDSRHYAAAYSSLIKGLASRP
jgi:D-inositol-3-phosphate glycosyltransferase